MEDENKHDNPEQINFDNWRVFRFTCILYLAQVYFTTLLASAISSLHFFGHYHGFLSLDFIATAISILIVSQVYLRRQNVS